VTTFLKVTGAEPPSPAARRPSHPAGPSAGNDCGLFPNPAQRPDRAERTPGGSLATNPPAMAAAAASTRGSRGGTIWARPCPILSPRSIAATGIWADFRASVEKDGADL